jgi:phosphohistidine phosphatase SixA
VGPGGWRGVVPYCGPQRAGAEMKLLFSIVTVLALTAPAAAQQATFVVRHAERADTASGGSPMMAADPELSEAGKSRAQALAEALKDAKITAIYTTQYKRTQQTAEPLAKALGIQPVVVGAGDIAGLVAKLKSGGNALVVGHSNSVGPIIQQLGITQPVQLADDEYDNLFIVVGNEKPTLIKLHFR